MSLVKLWRQDSYDIYGEDDFNENDKYESNKTEENDDEKNERKLINTTSIGLSFYVEKNTKIIQVHSSWGEYFSKKEEVAPEDLLDNNSKKKVVTKYQREPKEEYVEFDLSIIGKSISKKFDSDIEISIIKYDLKSDYSLVSVFLTNKKPSSTEVSSYMFQVKLEVICEQGFISESFARNNSFDDEFYYIEKPVFARGRGCAASWENNGLICNKVCTEFVPEEEINKWL